ncbi:MAG TPA: arylsulfotransferase family protein, partial [Gemmataceae bacterium]|nr:arylsulfotransferase family protein [Gemmataceae bacterium]
MALPRNSLRRCLFLFGVASLCYMLGAAVIYFDLPTADFLRRGFAGGLAWYEGEKTPQTPGQQLPPPTVGKIDQPDKTCDGFTLLMYGGDSQAMLVNMRGETVHRWHVPFNKLWPKPPHLNGRIDDATVYFNDGHIYPNGDLLVVIEGPINVHNSSNGYGLAKLDKDSNVIWKYAEKCHHDVDVGDDGTIYVLTNEIVHSVPKGLEFLPTPCMVDFVDVLSPDGKRLKRISILEALQNSPYAPLLCLLERPPAAGQMLLRMAPGAAPAPFEDDSRRRDVLHTNAVKVLKPGLASHFPLLKPGQILISPRHLDAIAVLDPESQRAVWAGKGSWHA